MIHKLKEELFHPIVSGFSATLLLLSAARLFREPRFADIYNFLIHHLVTFETDITPLASLLAAFSLFITGMDARKFIDNWIVIPILRLITHLFSVAAGAMVATAVIALAIGQGSSLYEHMLIPAIQFFIRAFLSTLYLLTIMIFSTERIGNSWRLKRWANFLGLTAVVGFYYLWEKL